MNFLQGLCRANTSSRPSSFRCASSWFLDHRWAHLMFLLLCISCALSQSALLTKDFPRPAGGRCFSLRGFEVGVAQERRWWINDKPPLPYCRPTDSHYWLDPLWRKGNMSLAWACCLTSRTSMLMDRPLSNRCVFILCRHFFMIQRQICRKSINFE